MTDQNVYQGAVNTFVEKPKFAITIPISWRPAPEPVPEVKQTLLNRMLNGKAEQIQPEPLPNEETFVIHPCKVANMWRIAGAATSLPDEIIEGSLTETVLPLVTDHLSTIVYIVASAIQNNHEEPKPELITFIERNFDSEDLHSCLLPALENVGMQSFLNSIVLAKGTTKILKPKASPTDGSE